VTFDVTSDSSVIVLNIYDRVVDESSANPTGFLGMLEIKPTLIDDHSVDNWYPLRPHGNEKITGSIRVQTTYEQYKTRRSLTPRDFEFLKLIGRGTFGRVFQVRKRDTKRIYAMKVLSKREIVAKKEVAHTIGEKKILQKSLSSPFLVGLKFSFQTETDLYLVTDFKSGGELFWHLQRDMRFPEDRARFYIAELILALEHLHKYDIVYRDLKPENILLDATGHIALCDFGLSKADLPSDQLTNTFCGTTEYLAPEVLLDDQGYSKLVDFWSLGVLLFEMCCGWSPFYDEDTQQMYKNICFGKIKFPRNVINEDGKHFVKGLLNRNPKHRLGSQRDTQELKEHPFFKVIDWHALALKQVTPPFIPEVESDESVAHFDPEFTGMSLQDLGVLEDSDFDDDDPSESWVESASLSSGFHMPNGPLGSDLTFTSLNGVNGGGNSSAPGSVPGSGANSGSRTPLPLENKPKRRRPPKPRENPLSSSVQENFKGFSYCGESLATNMLAVSAQRDLKAEAEAQGGGGGDDFRRNGRKRGVKRSGEEEFEDDSRVAGRYERDVDME